MKKLVILGIGIFLCSSLFAQPKVGKAALDIALRNVNGKQVRLSDYRGKIVLVDFWASWCGPCRRANPGLADLYNKYKSKGFEIFGVCIDDEQKAWKKAVQADKISWSQVIAKGGWESPVSLEWKLEQIPASFLIDQTGKVVAVDPTKEDIEQHLKTLLR